MFDRFEDRTRAVAAIYQRKDDASDRERYQTVYARERGSVAAPTAGLHFTGDVLEACGRRGAAVAYVTLHVGLGTFQPLHQQQVTQARLHARSAADYSENAERIRAAGRVVAVGDVRADGGAPGATER